MEKAEALLYLFSAVESVIFSTERFSNSLNYESLFEKLKVRENDIMITKLSKNNLNNINNEYHILESMFEKFTL